jgi:hypothetical protein
LSRAHSLSLTSEKERDDATAAEAARGAHTPDAPPLNRGPALSREARIARRASMAMAIRK